MTMIRSRARTPMKKPLLLIGLAAVLAACGGNAGIGGKVNGLASGQTLVLQNNGKDDESIVGTSATSLNFDFATSIASGSAYSVTVRTQPTGQTCSVVNGSGTVDVNGTGVSNIVVTCTSSSSVMAAVTGLKPNLGLTLATNGQVLPVTANGTFSFPTVITAGAIYEVTVSVQPVGQTCTVTNARGTVVANTTFTVAVNCV